MQREINFCAGKIWMYIIKIDKFYKERFGSSYGLYSGGTTWHLDSRQMRASEGNLGQVNLNRLN